MVETGFEPRICALYQLVFCFSQSHDQRDIAKFPVSAVRDTTFARIWFSIRRFFGCFLFLHSFQMTTTKKSFIFPGSLRCLFLVLFICCYFLQVMKISPYLKHQASVWYAQSGGQPGVFLPTPNIGCLEAGRKWSFRIPFLHISHGEINAPLSHPFIKTILRVEKYT